MSDLNERDIEASINIQGPDNEEVAGEIGDESVKRKKGAHPLTTPRLFQGLDGGIAGRKGNDEPSDDNSSACNLIESSRTGPLDSHRGNQRYQIDSRATPYLGEDDFSVF